MLRPDKQRKCSQTVSNTKITIKFNPDLTMHFTVELQPQTTFLYNKTLFRSLIFKFKSSCDGNNVSVKLSDSKIERIRTKTSQAPVHQN